MKKIKIKKIIYKKNAHSELLSIFFMVICFISFLIGITMLVSIADHGIYLAMQGKLEIQIIFGILFILYSPLVSCFVIFIYLIILFIIQIVKSKG